MLSQVQHFVIESGRIMQSEGATLIDIHDNLSSTARARISGLIGIPVRQGDCWRHRYRRRQQAQLILWLQSAGKKVAVDTSGVALKAAIAAHPWLIKPNTDELTETYHLPAETFAEQQHLFASLNSQIEHIVVSMGENGMTKPPHAPPACYCTEGHRPKYCGCGRFF